MDPTSGHTEGTVGDSTVPMVSEMQESGSIELDPSLCGPADREPEKAQTLPAEPPRTQAAMIEGTLTRKHELEPAGKKASNRSVSGVQSPTRSQSCCCESAFLLPLFYVMVQVIQFDRI